MTVYGLQSSETISFLSTVGTSFLTDRGALLKRWGAQFDSDLNQPSSIKDEAITGGMQSAA